jgi:hypothetical protein
MGKHFLFVLLLTAVASVFLRVILGNIPITATWLQDLQVYKQ